MKHMSGCYDCFKDSRSLNDIYAQIKIDAEKFAKEQNTKVAIIQEGPGFRIEAFDAGIPAGTREVIIPHLR